VRALIVVASICLAGCEQAFGPTAAPDLNSGTQDVQQTVEQAGKGACEKIAELKIGMPISQVQSLCEQQPLRTQRVITRSAKAALIWSYQNGHLTFENDELAQVQNLQ